MSSNNAVFELLLLDSESGCEAADFSLDANAQGIASPIPIRVEQATLAGGRQQGVKIITLTLGTMRVRVVPTRGMAVLDVTVDGTRFGWDSPVREVVNPAFINLEASGGLGWLDGFNEMLVRCGYQWTGHCGLDGDEFLTLHGRIQNTPASKVVLTIQREPPYRVTLTGRVDEKRFKFANFEVWMNLSLVPGEPYLHVEDYLTNKGPYRREYQVIYHNNFGPPVLEGGARLHVPTVEISPFNGLAASELDNWALIQPPQGHYDETLFNVRPANDSQGNSLCLLHNAAASLGIEVLFQTNTLPVLTIWKNTDLPAQGYVVGIEPGTSFAYNRKHQRALGLVPEIGPGESRAFSLRFGFLTKATEVAASSARIQTLQGSVSPRIRRQPLVRLDA